MARHWQFDSVSEPVATDFHKLLVYVTGGFFVDHCDTEMAPAAEASLDFGGNAVVHFQTF